MRVVVQLIATSALAVALIVAGVSTAGSGTQTFVGAALVPPHAATSVELADRFAGAQALVGDVHDMLPVSAAVAGLVAGNGLTAVAKVSALRATPVGTVGLATGHRAQGVTVEEDVWVTHCGEVGGVCVHAAETTSMRLVDRPSLYRPPTVVCVWYLYGRQPGGWGSPDGVVPVTYLQSGGLYVIDCHRTSDGERVTGYPRVVRHTHPGEQIPGQVVSESEVARYAMGQLSLQPPVASVAPGTFQVVGTETWFAVTSKLRDYPQRSAQAGSVWATVRADFVDVTWDFGSPHGQLRCTTDAGRAWNPRLSGEQQHSACTRVFHTKSNPGGSSATVTVTWRIYWSSSTHAGWRHFDDYRLSTPVQLDIRELQALIR